MSIVALKPEMVCRRLRSQRVLVQYVAGHGKVVLSYLSLVGFPAIGKARSGIESKLEGIVTRRSSVLAFRTFLGIHILLDEQLKPYRCPFRPQHTVPLAFSIVFQSS